jgi:hypothetical protein
MHCHALHRHDQDPGSVSTDLFPPPAPPTPLLPKPLLVAAPTFVLRSVTPSFDIKKEDVSTPQTPTRCTPRINTRAPSSSLSDRVSFIPSLSSNTSSRSVGTSKQATSYADPEDDLLKAMREVEISSPTLCLNDLLRKYYWVDGHVFATRYVISL